MANRQVFFVTSGRLAVYQWQGGRFANPLVFMADDEGLTQFALYLQHSPREAVYMLVDFVEEEFREDTIPHVLGPDRSALIRTKQNRLFRNPTYSHAILQGRQTEGRRDDSVLFTALIRPDLLAPWMGQIAKYKVPLAGIYSLALVSDSLLKLLKIESSHVLLVSLQSAGGLRQTFFHNGQVKLSRLAMMPQVQDRGYASYVLGEIEKIRRYLNSLRMLPQDRPLEVHLLGDAELLADMGLQSSNNDAVQHFRHDLGDVAQRLKIRDEYTSRYADRIFAHLLARHPVANQYATSEQRRYFNLGRVRSGLRVASLALMVGSAVWGGVKFVEGVSAAQEAGTVGAQVQFYNERYRRARGRLPETPADSRDMQQAVELVGTMRETKTWPYPMMATLSEGMRRFPRIKIEQMDWQTSTDPAARVGASTRGSARSSLRNLLGSSGRRSKSDASEGTSFYQLALVKGRVDNFTGDYREALEMVRSFADVLREREDVKDVNVIAFPLDIGSETRLSGDASSDADSRDAPFEIRIVVLERTVEAG